MEMHNFQMKMNELLGHVVAAWAAGTCDGTVGYGNRHCLRVEDCEIACAHAMGKRRDPLLGQGLLQGEQHMNQNRGRLGVPFRCTRTKVSKR